MIITLTGHKNSGKDIIAQKFDKNSGAEWIHPYTDAPEPSTEAYSKAYSTCHHTSRERLDKMIEFQTVLCCTNINGYRYVFFESQLKQPYSVMVIDDYALVDVRSRWKGKIYSIRVNSKNQTQSDRIGEYYYEHEFDEVFNYDSDDFDELEARISYVYR